MPRASSRITPPSGLQVNRQSSVPVHVQLTTQVRHLIQTGHLKPGMQLPTVRQLAGFLRINRNTAARALADLLKDGYLESRQGRGTFVVDQPPARQGRAARSLERLVEETTEKARRLGFTHEELLATVAARAPQAGRRPRATKLRALLVECNWEELNRYRETIEAELPLAVDRVLVEELEKRITEDPAFLAGYRVIVTTFFHIHEVKAAVPAEGPPVVALLSEANISTLLRLTELPAGTTVGLVCTTSTGSQNLLRSVQSAGLTADRARAGLGGRSLVDRAHARAHAHRALLRAGRLPHSQDHPAGCRADRVGSHAGSGGARAPARSRGAPGVRGGLEASLPGEPAVALTRQGLIQRRFHCSIAVSSSPSRNLKVSGRGNGGSTEGVQT